LLRRKKSQLKWEKPLPAAGVCPQFARGAQHAAGESSARKEGCRGEGTDATHSAKGEREVLKKRHCECGK